jgi:NhaP-type Na+/H+ or K+/H+ antiporter
VKLPDPAVQVHGTSLFDVELHAVFAPKLELDPELMVALFVAPVLLDAAYDTSARSTRSRRNSTSQK